MRVFVSCQAASHKPCSDLIFELRARGAEVEHSPLNPLDATDQRWDRWYQNGLADALNGCNTLVIVVDRGWDSSTWMAIEAQAGLEVLEGEPDRKAFFWNPEAIAVHAAGMLPYLKHELPRGLDEAVRIVLEATG